MRAFLCVILIIIGGGCSLMRYETQDQTSGMKYFPSPKEAVPVITELLRQEDFKTLAKYYDLSNSDISPADLESGDFFIEEKRPEVAHPAGFWRYKHPFPPGFKYSGMRPGVRERVHVISVKISIDQGAESPNQVGYSFFYMIESARGWQILPDRVAEDKTPELSSP
jgi:hypothetical protein